MANLVDRYLASFRRKADSTKRDRRYVLMEFAGWLGKPIDQAEPNDIEDWMDELTEEKGLKPSAINQYLAIVKGIYKWLASDLPVPVGTEELREVLMKQKRFGKIVAIERLEAGEISERAWDEGQLKALLRASKEEPDVNRIIFLGCYFGLRRDELRLLRTGDVDFKNRTVSIRREITKTPAGVRTLHFHPAVAEYLRSDGGYVIGGKEPYSKSFFYSIWRPYDRIVGFHLRTKQMRSTFDSWMGDALDPVLGARNANYVIKRLMGHRVKGTDMTEHYRGETKKLEEDMRMAMTEHHYFKGWAII
jgi:integrase